MPVRPEDKIRCSFCGKSQEQVRKMIAGTGNNVFICDECIELCSEILEEELGHEEGEKQPDLRSGINLLKPKEIKAVPGRVRDGTGGGQKGPVCSLYTTTIRGSPPSRESGCGASRRAIS